MLGRRGMLRLMGLTAAGVLAGCARTEESHVVRDGNAPAAEPGPQPHVHREVVHSTSRGVDVELYLAYPTGLPSTDRLPLVLYLHGRDAMRPTPIPFDTLAALERQYQRGEIPAFGFVSVDGGYNAYWNDGSANGDLLTMLLAELPEWLRQRGLGADGAPFASAGISTGGFGALNYAMARQAQGTPVHALGVLSPALCLTWERMRVREAFADEQSWQAVDPLRRVPDLGAVPMGVWVGADDEFRAGAEHLVAEHPNTPIFTVLPGGHERSVFEQVGDPMVRFFADHVVA